MCIYIYVGKSLRIYKGNRGYMGAMEGCTELYSKQPPKQMWCRGHLGPLKEV